ncbi:hypothetical protein BKP35_13070 [Anaerobacillus arseniciselenatis]|uniref:Uncharacterized protein n=1 Tax=Anaerobacillus arseniciselenatis TaxID=85682 RepID=A0A1S2LFL9_9BACI|nr:hypothetical protein [Anaerobacillus arseniciselenatis]OIJ10863.1 hypothetical protein BKP35_13070 [Anaerobacillus arseniciselenatis]
MKSRLNKYPFLIVGFIHLVMLIYTFYKSSDKKKHLVLLLNFVGFAYIFDYIIVVFLNGYKYKPCFLKQNYLDNIFGAVLSQFFYVPVTALFITVMKFGWISKILFSLYFVLIERLFVNLRIYKNKWRRTHYTFSLILVSFYFNDKWAEQIVKRNLIILFVSVFSFLH